MRASELQPGEIGRTERGRLVRRSNGGDKLYAIDDAYLHLWHDYDTEVERLVPESEVAELESWREKLNDVLDPEEYHDWDEILAEISRQQRMVGDAETAAHLEQQVAELNNLLRAAGWGQGEIDSAATVVEEAEAKVAELTAKLAAVESGVRSFVEGIGYKEWKDVVDSVTVDYQGKWHLGTVPFARLAGLVAPAPVAPQVSECKTNPILSRTCQRGTKCCEVDHDEPAPLPEPTTKDHTETGWLIELFDDRVDVAPRWLKLGGEAPWTLNSDRALRFARQCDAEQYLKSHVAEKDWIKVTEHQWGPDAPLPEPAEPEPRRNCQPLSAKPDCLKDVPAVLCNYLVAEEVSTTVWAYGPIVRGTAMYCDHEDRGPLSVGYTSLEFLHPLYHDPGAKELREQIEAARGGASC